MKTVFGWAVAAFIAFSPAQMALADEQMHADTAVEAAQDAEVSADLNAELNADSHEVALLDGGTLLIEGDMVYTVDAEGNKVTAADGDYTLSDNTLVTVSEGRLDFGVGMDAESGVTAEPASGEPAFESDMAD